MIQKITLTIFFTCLFITAALVLYFVWSEGPPTDTWGQIAGTTFIVGLTSFLTWITESIYRMKVVANKEK